MSTTKINEYCWAGIKTLHDAGLIKPAEDSEDIQQCSSWPKGLNFDDEGYVTLVDIGGKRLYKGLPCDPQVFSQFSKLQALNLGGTDLPLKDIMAILEQVSSRVHTIYLGGNGLGVDGAKAIASWLPSASNLITLDLRYNDIGGA